MQKYVKGWRINDYCLGGMTNDEVAKFFIREVEAVEPMAPAVQPAAPAQQQWTVTVKGKGGSFSLQGVSASVKDGTITATTVAPSLVSATQQQWTVTVQGMDGSFSLQGVSASVKDGTITATTVAPAPESATVRYYDGDDDKGIFVAKIVRTGDSSNTFYNDRERPMLVKAMENPPTLGQNEHVNADRTTDFSKADTHVKKQLD